jgi:hypothetical protein
MKVGGSSGQGATPSNSSQVNQSQTNPSTQDQAAEIDAMATKVWSILKRKMSIELHRHGRY